MELARRQLAAGKHHASACDIDWALATRGDPITYYGGPEHVVLDSSVRLLERGLRFDDALANQESVRSLCCC